MMTESAPTPQTRVVRVWDVPVRFVHWLIVVLLAVSWWTAETGRMEWHQYSGFTMLALLVFRVYWGFFGSSTARFANFVRGPRVIATYVKGRWAAMPGHNPLGALSVVALFSLLLAQVALGLFAVDVDGIESGPLSIYVSFDAGRVAAKWHHTVFDILLWLVALHVVAVFYYVFIKKENLVGAMISGKRTYPEGEFAHVASVSKLRVVVGALIACAFTWWIAST
jgi:cytochrome b